MSFTIWQAQSRNLWMLLAPAAILEDLTEDLLELLLLPQTVEHCIMDVAQYYLPVTVSSSGCAKGSGRAGPQVVLVLSDLELTAWL